MLLTQPKPIWECRPRKIGRKVVLSLSIKERKGLELEGLREAFHLLQLPTENDEYFSRQILNRNWSIAQKVVANISFLGKCNAERQTKRSKIFFSKRKDFHSEWKTFALTFGLFLPTGLFLLNVQMNNLVVIGCDGLRILRNFKIVLVTLRYNANMLLLDKRLVTGII